MRSPLPVAVFDADLRIAWANKAAEKLSRRGTVRPWRGRRLGDPLPGTEAGPVERSLCSVLETGQPVTGLQMSSQAVDDPGSERIWSCLQFPYVPGLELAYRYVPRKRQRKSAVTGSTSSPSARGALP